MKAFALSIFTFLILTVFGCKSKNSLQTLHPDTMLYKLKKGSCFGKCPTYTLSIFANGKALLEGRGNIQYIGTFINQLTQEEMESLANLFQKSDFENYQLEYKSYIADLPGIWITYNNGKNTKTVYGKEGRPAKLEAIQKIMEAIVETKKNWKQLNIQKIDNENYEASPGSSDQLIVETISEKLTQAWLDKYKPYQLKVNKRLTLELNYYILSFDDKSIKAKELIALLKKDPFIKGVQLNKKINQR